MPVVAELIDAMAQYEIRYGVKPHEIVFTPEGYEAFVKEVDAYDVAPFLFSSGSDTHDTPPSFNGAAIVVRDAT